MNAVTGRSARVEVESGVELRTLTWGEPGGSLPSLLLVHGLASNAVMWEGVGRVVAERGGHAVAVDLRGHGLSDGPDHGYEFDRIVADLGQVIAYHGLERPLVMGQSWGGNLAIEMGWSQPGAVAGIVAVDGGLIDLASRFESWEECARVLKPPTLTGTPRAEFEARIRAAYAQWPETAIHGVMACFDVDADDRIRPHLTLERHMRILRSLWEHRPFERFAEIEPAVLFVMADAGDRSWTVDREEAAARAVRELARGRVEWFRPAHHDLHAQYPEPLSELVMGLWREGFFAVR